MTGAVLNDRHLAPSQWAEGDRPLGVFLLRPEPATAPGSYTLKLAVYDPVTLAQLPATGAGVEGTFVTLGEVSLAHATRAPAVEQLRLDVPTSFSWRGLRLLGRGPLPTSLSPGDSLPVDLYWQAEQPSRPDVAVAARAAAHRGDRVCPGSDSPSMAGSPTAMRPMVGRPGRSCATDRCGGWILRSRPAPIASCSGCWPGTASSPGGRAGNGRGGGPGTQLRAARTHGADGRAQRLATWRGCSAMTGRSLLTAPWH